jgi:amino acid adenylation domain-containing protein
VAVSEASNKLAGLSREQLDQLIRKLKAKDGAPQRAAGGTLPRRSGDRSRAPLSSSQRRLWLIDQLQPGSAAYNLSTVLTLRGALDPHALERSLAGIVARHEVLRTRYLRTESGEPEQVIDPPPRWVLPAIDLGGLPPALARATAEARALEDARRPFDLAAGPIARFRLLRVAPGEHLLVLALHHIAGDGWSTGVLLKELATSYASWQAGRAPSLPELPVQYADYAVWQAAQAAGEGFARQLEHWRTTLTGAPEVLDLPTDHPRPSVLSFAGDVGPVAIPAAVAARLESTARATGSTPFMVLAAAFDVLLMRWSGATDIVVGTPVAGRRALETEPLIGFFVNTLVLRADLAGNPSFGTAVARLTEVTKAAFDHQDVPFERLVEELVPQRDLARNALFQVLFVLQNDGGGSLTMPGLELGTLPVATGTSKLDLTLALGPSADGGLAGQLEYRTDLFEAATLERLAREFGRLLAAGLERPETPVWQLPLLDAAERAQLAAWNQTALETPDARPLGELLEQTVDRLPEAVAVSSELETITYLELDRRANRLAHALAAHGVGPGRRVGLLAERSVEHVVGLFAIWKAAGTYVPLEPDNPPLRLAGMVEDAAIEIVLFHAHQAASPLLEQPGVRALALEAGGHAALSSARPARRANLDTPAYAIFTSGSTGRPKGALNDHRGLVNRLLWIERTLPLGTDARLLQKTPASFDVSLGELAWPMLVGAQLVLAAPGGHRDPLYLARTLAERQITNVHFVPSMLGAFLEVADHANTASLRRVLASGEALAPAQITAFEARCGAELVNLYGPTEAAVEVSWWRAPRPCRESTVPIGTAVANTALHVVDPYLGLVPVGVPGELLLGGIQVGGGYLGRPRLTAQTFVPDPFAAPSRVVGAARPGARLYRTGDLVKRRPTGEIDFLGRIDHQVKVRGLRIELGEIEAGLAADAAVREVVVIARPGAGGDSTLVAYLVASGEPAALEARLRESLGERVPAYMVPTFFVFLPELPLSPNGKIDRKRLPEPTVAASDRAAHVAIEGPVQEAIAAPFRRELGLERTAELSAEDNFFALGGHSLAATRLATRLAETFGFELPLRRVFEAPTVAGLARIVGELASGGSRVAPLVAQERPARPALSFAQERLWFLEQMDPGGSAYNLGSALELEGELDAHALGRALSEVVARHESLRTIFPQGADGPWQQVQAPSRLPTPYVDLTGLSAAAGQEVALTLARRDAETGFDLERGPLTRVRLLRLARDRHVFVLTQHHIVSDGWSATVFVRELATLYRAFAAGRPSPLAPLPLSYVDFALWHRAWLASGELERQLGFWRQRLAGAPELLELPTDRPRPAIAGPQGRRLPVRLPTELAERLRALARAHGATLFMALHAGFAWLLGKLAGSPDVVVGSPIANRTRAEVENLIGFFVNTLALRLGLAPTASFEQLLASARRANLDAYTHQDVPFERLVAELAPRRSRSHAPLFQVMLTLQNLGTQENRPDASEPGFVARPLWVPQATTKFDLSLTLVDAAPELTGLVGFKTDLFDESTIVRWLGHLERLLAAAVATPDRPLASLEWLTPAERHQLLLGWNDAPALPARPFVSLTERFVGWVSKTPDATALLVEGEPLSYRELDRRASRLALELIAAGVTAEVRVAIALDRSAEMVVAVLAVLKAGGAYVPLDVTHPADRLAFVLDDCRPRVVLTREAFLGHFASMSLEATPLFLSVEALAVGEPVASFTAPVLPEQLAYVIYTSGSTGRPKGVGIAHAAIAGRVATYVELAELGPGDRQLQFASLTFDMSCEELYPPLTAGAAVVLETRPAAKRPSELIADCTQWQVTKLTLPSSYCHGLLDELVATGRSLPPTLRLLYTGAEAPSLEKFSAVPALAGRPVACYNNYGPTETTIFVLGGPMPLDAPPGTRVTIGRPIPGCRAVIVDRALRPQPIGVAGELALGGEGVARGYLGRPALTAEHFVPDPFSTEPGARLYLSGDLARLRADGEVEFVGRLDHQVKVRGFRIELGEIEEQLRRHPQVVEAAAAVRRDPSGDPRLVGYYVPAPGAEPSYAGPSHDALRAHLAASLPEYMVPAFLVRLQALPKSSSGKVDTKALPDPTEASLGGDRPYEPTQGPVEGYLAELWTALLGVARVGRHDNFFALGGDSMKAALLIRRLEQKLGAYVYVTALFDTADLADLAAYLVREYPQETARELGAEAVASAEVVAVVDEARLAELDAIVPRLAPRSRPAARNRPAVFVLSPPRSGSTLLRVMLAGNPHLFAPPELELAGFHTLGERREALSGRWALWQEGVLRAWMEVLGASADEARRHMTALEDADLTVAGLYGELQAALGERLLVDKTPSYALDRATLERLEQDFEGARYIHLLRHPMAAIASFEEARLEQTFFRYEHPFARRELAEMIWTRSHRNIEAFLAQVPAERVTTVRFEALVADPRPVLEPLCAFLGVPFDEAMLDPYAQKQQRMTDGIHKLSKMVGDVKFHSHSKVDAQVADRWRQVYPESFLGEPARAVAAKLGYADVAAPPNPNRTSPGRRFPNLVALRPGSGERPLFLVHAIFGDVHFFRHLAAELPTQLPIFGLAAVGLDGEETPLDTVPAILERYTAAIRAVAPHGPYRLAGSSMGGLLAFELARALEAAGETVELLALLDPPEPDAITPGYGTIDFETAALSYVLDAEREPAPFAELARLSERGARRALVLAAAQAAGALPPTATLEDLERLSGVVEANRRALQGFVPGLYGGGALVVRAEATAARLPARGASGWQRHCRGAVEVVTLPGEHMSILFPPRVARLAHLLTASLPTASLAEGDDAATLDDRSGEALASR